MELGKVSDLRGEGLGNKEGGGWCLWIKGRGGGDAPMHIMENFAALN